jgi:hypothetical protein
MTKQPTELFDFLVVEQLLNTSRRPHVLLRRSANQLKWSGWLIVGCSIFDFQTLGNNWAKSPSIAQPDYEISFSAKALGDLLQITGFTPRHVLGLTQLQVEDFALETATRAEMVHNLSHKLFQTVPENPLNSSCVVVLACQRTF